jgi:hypothetical protein
MIVISELMQAVSGEVKLMFTTAGKLVPELMLSFTLCNLPVVCIIVPGKEALTEESVAGNSQIKITVHLFRKQRNIKIAILQASHQSQVDFVVSGK